MLVQVEISVKGVITSSEAQEGFTSPWRALADTIAGCPPYDKLYRPRDVQVIDGWHTVKFEDGTQVRAKPI